MSTRPAVIDYQCLSPGPVQTQLNPDLVESERHALVQRVAGAPAFLKAHRVRELLLFVADHAISHPDQPLPEQEIGTALYGRPPEYDKSNDAIVRAHASLLRKKLQQYFDEEGRDEPFLIVLPKGSYVPLFQARHAAATGDPAQAIPPLHPSLPGLPVMAAVALAFLAVGLAAGYLWARRGLAPAPPPDIVVELWRHMLPNGRRASLVLADGSLTQFQDLLRQDLSALDYQAQQFNTIVDRANLDPLSRSLAKDAMGRFFTSVSDAHMARKVNSVMDRAGLPLEVLFARHFDVRQLGAQNVILSGGRRSNPWVELFEPRLNFQTHFYRVNDKLMVEFTNRAPQPGEAPSYKCVWSQTGYCRVAYLPNLNQSGSAILVSGTDMSSTEAGAEFLTSPVWVDRLATLLHWQPGRPLPHFEVLLKTDLLLSTAPGFTIQTHRQGREPRTK